MTKGIQTLTTAIILAYATHYGYTQKNTDRNKQETQEILQQKVFSSI